MPLGGVLAGRNGLTAALVNSPVIGAICTHIVEHGLTYDRLDQDEAAHRSGSAPDPTTSASQHVRAAQSSSLRALMKTSPGTSTRPIDFIFFLPSFCFSSSLRLRLMSPP